MKIPDDFSGSLRFEVHQHVSAENHVHRVCIVHKRRIDVFREIQIGECDHFSDPGQEFETLATGFKIILFQPCWRATERPFAENTFPRLLQETRINIRAENSHLPLPQIGQNSVQQYRDRIGFLARATARAPKPQTPFGTAPRMDYFGQEAFTENVEAALLPKKISFPNRQFTCQNLNLVPRQRRGQEPPRVRLRIGVTKLACGQADASFQVTPAFARKVQAYLSGHKVAQLHEQLL